MDQKVLMIEELPSIKDKFSLAGKTAFVTGAAGGIGVPLRQLWQSWAQMWR